MDFCQKITTRKSGNSSTLIDIDHIFTKINKGNTLAGTLTVEYFASISKCFLVETLNSKDVNSNYIKMRDVNLSNIQAMKDDLNHCNWKNVLQYYEDVNAAYNSCYNSYNSCS